MKDYMHLMARLPYIGKFPDSLVPTREEIDSIPEFNNFTVTQKMTQYNKFVEEIGIEIFNIRSNKNYLSPIFSVHFISQNPLKREMEVLKMKWTLLEELETHEADTDWLWIYREKLELIWKVKSFDKVKGYEKYSSLVEEVKKIANE